MSDRTLLWTLPMRLMSLETISVDSLTYKSIDQSSLFRLSYGCDLRSQLIGNHSIEFRIPRHPIVFISSITRENVTSIIINQTSLLPHQLLFYVHYVNLITHTHFLFLFVFEWDRWMRVSPITSFTSSIITRTKQFHSVHWRWTLFCPPHSPSPSQQSNTYEILSLIVRQRIGVFRNATNESVIFEYFFANDHMFGHWSVIFGLRELNDIELDHYCHKASNIVLVQPPTIADEGFRFTADYEVRLFTSGCYHLDDNQEWKPDGLLVRSLSLSVEWDLLLRTLPTPSIDFSTQNRLFRFSAIPVARRILFNNMYRLHRKYCSLPVLQRFLWHVAPSIVVAIATLFLDFLVFDSIDECRW